MTLRKKKNKEDGVGGEVGGGGAPQGMERGSCNLSLGVSVWGDRGCGLHRGWNPILNEGLGKLISLLVWRMLACVGVRLRVRVLCREVLDVSLWV